MKTKKGMGAHILVDLFDCKTEDLEFVKRVKTIMDEIVTEAKLTKLNEVFHQFQPKGVTGLALLSESHISIHTWPELKSAAVDIFCCSGIEDAERAFGVLIQKFKPGRYKKKVIKR